MGTLQWWQNEGHGVGGRAKGPWRQKKWEDRWRAVEVWGGRERKREGRRAARSRTYSGAQLPVKSVVLATRRCSKVEGCRSLQLQTTCCQGNRTHLRHMVTGQEDLGGCQKSSAQGRQAAVIGCAFIRSPILGTYTAHLDISTQLLYSLCPSSQCLYPHLGKGALYQTASK